MRKFYIAVTLCLVGAIVFSVPLFAQTYPAGFAQQRVSGSLAVQTAVAFAPDGRIFVAEQSGRVRIIRNGATLATPFITLTVDSRGERGLLGIAVDPDFLTNKWIYVYYTVPGTPARNRVSRFNATNDVVSGGETVILNLEALGSSFIHNAGALRFGPDGKLYVAVGENANTMSAQNLDSYNGKLLRINKDGSVPTGNPFTTGSEQRRRVWAYGLRNPFTFAIDQETGKIFVNDVGQALWEEVNDATVGGRNFGWPLTEGKFTQASFPALTNPIYAYPHPPGGGSTGDGNGCAIVGGTFISPSNTNYPAQYRGKYFFQENCGNWINMLDVSTATAVRSPFATGVTANSLGLTMGIDGLMYFCARHGETLYRIVYNNTAVPTITNHPANSSVAVGQPASFSVGALGTPPLTYRWQKNNVDIPGAPNSATYSIPQTTLGHAGNYRVIVSNASGNVTSNAATLTVINNLLPVAEILTPVAGTTYVAGATTINFSGTGSDPEQGNLPASAMSWSINFHHDTHHHDQPPINGVASGTFAVPDEGETSDNVWYRIILTVTDNFGLKGKDSVDIFPTKSTLTFATDPPGLQITLDGQPFNTPGSVVSVEGIKRELGVISPQIINGQAYEFSSWSNGGTQTQTIATPTADASYTATFIPSLFTNIIRINSGGPAQNFAGEVWSADQYFTGGTAFTTGAAISNTTKDQIYQSERWGNFSYAIPVPGPGTYAVDLHLAEIFFTAAGPRVFNINIENGQFVRTNFDIMQTYGANYQANVLRADNLNITDGTINITFTGVVDNAKISGIEVGRYNATGNTPPVVVQPFPDQSVASTQTSLVVNLAQIFNDDGGASNLTFTVPNNTNAALISNTQIVGTQLTFTLTGTTGSGMITLRATDASAASVDDVFQLTVTPGGTAQLVNLIRINSGGPAQNFAGEVWSADQYFTGGTAFTTGAAISNTTKDQIYQSERWGTFQYAIPVPSQGMYAVDLHLAEIFFTTAGPRVFNINIENGQFVRTNFDIMQTYGANYQANVLRADNLNITDGTINITFTGVVDNAKISGIEVGRYNTTGNTPPVVVQPFPDQSVASTQTSLGVNLAQIFNDDGGASNLTFTVPSNTNTALISNTQIAGTQLTFTLSGTTGSGMITLRATDASAASVDDVFQLTVTPGGTAEMVSLVRINSGGPAQNFAGEVWSADQYFTGGTPFTSFSPISNTTKDQIYQTERWGNFTYAIPVPAQGMYAVDLHLAEIFFTTAGPRVFNINIENGQFVRTNFDIMQTYGANYQANVLRADNLNITDGAINITFTGVVDNAKISGMEVWTINQPASGPSNARYATDDTETDIGEGDGSDLTFFPNPFSSKVTIAFTSKRSAKTSISVYDVRGVKLYSLFDEAVPSGHRGELELEPTNLPDGIYILEMINGEETKRLKMMLAR